MKFHKDSTVRYVVGPTPSSLIRPLRRVDALVGKDNPWGCVSQSKGISGDKTWFGKNKSRTNQQSIKNLSRTFLSMESAFFFFCSLFADKSSRIHQEPINNLSTIYQELFGGVKVSKSSEETSFRIKRTFDSKTRQGKKISILVEPPCVDSPRKPRITPSCWS